MKDILRAIHMPTLSTFEIVALPGTLHFAPRDAAGEFDMHYFCPGGSGVRQVIRVGEGFKPEGPGASWQWNGSRSEPTLSPSVNHVGHWHGWLRDGYWERV